MASLFFFCFFFFCFVCLVLFFQQLPNEKSIHQWPGRSGSNPRSSHTKDSKMIVGTASLNTQYMERIKGSGAIQGME